MKKFLFIIFLLSLEVVAISQTNLVPNPSFETYTNCPGESNTCAPDVVGFAVGWSSSYATPDYYNACATWPGSNNPGVPGNFLGYRYAFNGNAYCGFGVYYAPLLSRELISAKLTTTLTVGQKYNVSFRVVPTFCCNTGIAVDRICARFTTYACGFNMGSPPIDNNPQVTSNAMISDTTNWTLVSGTFCADSSYQYITLGNFFTNFATNTAVITPSSNIAYYFIDDIKVYHDPALCESGLNEVDKSGESILVSPNPTKGQFKITSLGTEQYSLMLFDINGKLLFNQDFAGNSNIDLSFLSNGVFNLTIKTPVNIFSKKLVILK